MANEIQRYDEFAGINHSGILVRWPGLEQDNVWRTFQGFDEIAAQQKKAASTAAKSELSINLEIISRHLERRHANPA